jgi:tetratricopeptide (TPR) repeat protein
MAPRLPSGRMREPCQARRAPFRGGGNHGAADTTGQGRVRHSSNLPRWARVVSCAPVKRDEKEEAEHAAQHANAREWEDVEDAVELLHDEQFQEALYALRDVIKKNPKNAYAYYFLGVALFETAQAEPARDAYRAALKLSPDYLGARVSLSHVLRMLGDLRGAIAEAEEALKRVPSDGDALHAAGLAHAARGDNAAARRYLNAFLASNPEFEAATEARSILATLDQGDN